MIKSSKGRFKCPHEAQAVWNAFKEQTANVFNVKYFEDDKQINGVLEFESFAKSLHKARLIHGSIYDEDGRIEDKDVAHEIWLSHQEIICPSVNIIGHIRDCVRTGKIRGTIFYE